MLSCWVPPAVLEALLATVHVWVLKVSPISLQASRMPRQPQHLFLSSLDAALTSWTVLGFGRLAGLSLYPPKIPYTTKPKEVYYDGKNF